MKRYRAIFLDWDDTIGDWSHAEQCALQDLYVIYQLKSVYPTAADFIAAYKPYNMELWTQYGRGEISKEELHFQRFHHVMGNPAQAREAGDIFLQLTNKYFSLMPYAEETVRYLAEKYPLTIISNGFKEVQYYKFAHSGLQDYFSYTLISEEVGINKPQPQLFEKALQLNGVNANEALMIGDSYTSDIAGAKAAGIDSLWIKSDGLSEEGKEATYIVADLRGVMQIV